MNPILVFLALLVGGGLGGFFGVVVAVPALAVLRVASSLTFAPGLVLAGTCAVVLMFVTSRTAAWLAGWVGLDAAFVLLWTLLRWPTALLLLALVVAAVYRYAPDADLSFRSVLPGALVAVLSWALASLVFSFGLTVFPDHGAAYGAWARRSRCSSTSTSPRPSCSSARS